MTFKSGTSVYSYLAGVKERLGAGFLVLLDPDRSPQDTVVEQAV